MDRKRNEEVKNELGWTILPSTWKWFIKRNWNTTVTRTRDKLSSVNIEIGTVVKSNVDRNYTNSGNPITKKNYRDSFRVLFEMFLPHNSVDCLRKCHLHGTVFVKNVIFYRIFYRVFYIESRSRSRCRYSDYFTEDIFFIRCIYMAIATDPTPREKSTETENYREKNR